MANGEILACSKFYVKMDGLEDLYVKSISGIAITLDTTGDTKPFGVSKDGVTQMQATITGCTTGTVTIVYVGTTDEKKLQQWYADCHSAPMLGGGTASAGALKSGSIVLYNQGGQEAATWTFTGAMCKSYKTSKFAPDSTELFTETVEVGFHSLLRTK
ncbi:phage tail protein [Tumidithrix helvetica PCC 7403]|uniref:phage tail protein n=1 Tax=Tumidithrix helvetica TaxID=3457545 RepID=UPI003C964BAE